MYWIYLALFLLAVLTPEAVTNDRFPVSEEHAESMIVFLFGAIGFLIYFAKEKALSRTKIDRARLQREKRDMTKDLSESYSYIGEVNRKMDVAREFIRMLPKMLGGLETKSRKDLYREFLSSAILFTKSDSFSLRIVDCDRHRIEKEICDGKETSCIRFSADELLSSRKTIREDRGFIVVRSPDSVGSFRAFLVFRKTSNEPEDTRMLEALASEGLALFFLERTFRPADRRRRSRGKNIPV